MTLPLAIKLVDVVPMDKWVTNEEIQRLIENKYGPHEMKRIQAVVSNMQRSRFCKVHRRSLDKSRNKYCFRVVEFAYIKLVLGKKRPDDLPEWVTEQLKPTEAYSSSDLMSEFNELIAAARVNSNARGGQYGTTA